MKQNLGKVVDISLLYSKNHRLFLIALSQSQIPEFHFSLKRYFYQFLLTEGT